MYTICMAYMVYTLYTSTTRAGTVTRLEITHPATLSSVSQSRVRTFQFHNNVPVETVKPESSVTNNNLPDRTILRIIPSVLEILSRC